MGQIAIVATLKPGANERARTVLEAEPPFDPAEQRFERHTVFLSANEVVFVFEAPEVEWRLDDLVDDPASLGLAEAFEAWRPLIDGQPRLARVAHRWQAEAPPPRSRPGV